MVSWSVRSPPHIKQPDNSHTGEWNKWISFNPGLTIHIENILTISTAHEHYL